MNKNVVLIFVLLFSILVAATVPLALRAAARITAVSASPSPQQFTPADLAAAPAVTCSELVLNGSMEDDAAWVMPATPATAAYSTARARTGDRSIRIGIVSGQNRLAYSSARQQVTIPSTTMTATLTFWLYPISSGTQLAQPTAELLTGAIHDYSPADTQDGRLPAAPAAGDAQYLLILDENLTIRQRLLWVRRNSQTWESYTFDLSAYKGQTIWLHFGVYNDGAGGITGMYLDDVSLTACRPLVDLSHHWFLPLILRNATAPEPPPPPPPGLLIIDGHKATHLVGNSHSQVIYAVTPAGFYHSDNGAATWSLMTTQLPVSRTIQLAPNQPDVLYAGQGYPCFKGGPDTPMWKSEDKGQTWSELPAGVNLEPLAVHPTDAQRVYAQGCDGPRLSTDGGESWTHQENDLFLVYNVPHLAPVAADDWQTVYIGGATEGGGGGIIGSQNGGDDWELLTPLTAEVWAISALAVDPISPTHLYFGHPLGFWGSIDGGASWYTSTTGLESVIYDLDGPADQTYGLLSLAIVPTNLEHLLLGAADGLYGSNDRGLTWTRLTGPVWQDKRITDLLLRTAEPDKLFLTTPDGVYIHHLASFP